MDTRISDDNVYNEHCTYSTWLAHTHARGADTHTNTQTHTNGIPSKTLGEHVTVWGLVTVGWPGEVLDIAKNILDSCS